MPERPPWFRRRSILNAKVEVILLHLYTLCSYNSLLTFAISLSSIRLKIAQAVLSVPRPVVALRGDSE